MTGFLAIVSYHGVELALGTVTFSKHDASIYVRPISEPDAVYDYGFAIIPAGSSNWTFTTAGQLQASERPHISIHESGKCHVRAGSGASSRAEGSSIGPLNAFKRKHVATIFTSDVESLPRFAGVWPDEGARDQDAETWDITPPAEARSIRIAVFVSRNPQNPDPASYAHREEQLRRSDGGFLSVLTNAFAAPSPLGVSSVGAVGGWDPMTAHDSSTASRLVYVRDVRDGTEA
jgi:hypothetical protein